MQALSERLTVEAKLTAMPPEARVAFLTDILLDNTAALNKLPCVQGPDCPVSAGLSKTEKVKIGAVASGASTLVYAIIQIILAFNGG